MKNEFLSVSQFCELHKMDRRNVRRYIDSGRIPAMKVGGTWIIPVDASRPTDARVKSGIYKKFGKKETRT
jgi:excisionase family DNA binding protein